MGRPLSDEYIEAHVLELLEHRGDDEDFTATLESLRETIEVTENPYALYEEHVEFRGLRVPVGLVQEVGGLGEW